MELSWFRDQLRPLVVEREIGGGDRKAHHNLLSRFQMDAPKGLEFPHRPAHRRGILVEVELDDFIGIACASIGHFSGGCQTAPLAQLRIGQAQARVFEGCVREPESEWILGREIYIQIL